MKEGNTNTITSDLNNLPFMNNLTLTTNLMLNFIKTFIVVTSIYEQTTFLTDNLETSWHE